MKTSDLVFIGIKASVVALDRATGQQVWATHLKGSDFVNVVVQNGSSSRFGHFAIKAAYCPARDVWQRVDDGVAAEGLRTGRRVLEPTRRVAAEG